MRPHPIAIIVGFAICGLGAFLGMEEDARQMVLGELLGGALVGLLFFVGAMVAGGKATRWSIMASFSPARRSERASLNKSIDKELSKVVFPWSGLLALLGGSAFLLLKPVLFTARGVGLFAGEFSVGEYAYFQRAHQSFVIAGVVLGLFALALMSQARLMRGAK